MHGASAGAATATASLGVTGRDARAAAVRELPVKDSEEAWTPAELAEVRGELTAEVDRLTRELDDATSSFSALVRSGGEGAGDDQVDHGATTAGREHEMTIVNNARDLLEQTQRALVRMSSGVYGVCESCGGAVGKARLQAFPRVTLCLPCKSRAERR
ncbi:TraR/DksA family transcriptional regulator [Kineococcus aurantiacus]|uniref:DnaK suppressor protein n=1 Tax=Kineococcus aurantiacus TaxID=37633 RepID=A0A7Y9ATD3_9ACTN|nr:TraR/DksA C4-type zinc finger protein [Kineococcus aurantiacus]NYD21023.1 DnaK suppressor protein [Kineococcus aurantiacus]